MKILILSDDFPPKAGGGAGIVAADVAVEFARQGNEVRVLTTVRSAEDAGEHVYEGIPVRALRSSYHERFRAYRSLRNGALLPHVKKMLDEFNPDAVHAHNVHYHLSYASLKLAKLSGSKVVLTVHDGMLFHYGKFSEYIDPAWRGPLPTPDYRLSPFAVLKTYKRRYNPFRNLIIRQYLRYCDDVCAVSGRLREALEANGIKGVRVVHNGIDLSLWKPRAEPDALKLFREKYGLGGKKIVLFAGRLSEAKGGAVTVQALKEVVSKVPQAALLVVGKKDEYAGRMESMAAKLGIEGSMIFTGWIDGAVLRAAYESSDVVVFPSVYFDAFGLVNLEGMAMEKPVVATCFGGAPEIVEDGATGTIVNPYDSASYSAAIAGLLLDPEKAAIFGKAGRERVERLFTLSRQAESYLALFRR
jgi:glycosyltransferase involved in cell wall biosynthesis